MIYVTALDGSQGDLYWGVLGGGSYDAWETLMMVDIGLSYGVKESEIVRSNVLDLQVRNFLRDRRLVLNFDLPQASLVEAQVFDASGRCVLLKTSELEAGDQEIILETRSLPSGTYVVRLDALNLNQSGKFVIF
jgi:hypothetical protein